LYAIDGKQLNAFFHTFLQALKPFFINGFKAFFGLKFLPEFSINFFLLGVPLPKKKDRAGSGYAQ
jgi:hypothetical protein